jgi:pyruvate,water dikinase
MIIEAVWGLGEALVGGQVTPDSYVIDKRDWSLIDVSTTEQPKMIARKNAGTAMVSVPSKLVKRQKLDGEQVIELAKLCAAIEKHYKFPCDIEWCLENKMFYIVQSRPIITL